MKARMTISILLIQLLGISDAVAQEKRVSVTSNVDSAAVFIDDAWVGRAADSPFFVASDASVVTVRLPWLSAWSIEPLHFDLESGDTSVKAEFPFHYRFESVPSGATVFEGSNQLGKTPFTHRTDKALDGSVRVSLPGYLDAVPNLDTAIWSKVRVEMLPDAASSLAVGSEHIVPKARKDWVSIAATASAFAAGALAIHFRTRADNRFSDYQKSGKESLRSDVQRLDVQSGVALGVMHAGLGIVVFRLAF